MKLGIQPIESGANVLDFPGAMIMLARAQSRPAKIEAQHRKPEAVQRLHGVEDNFVVQRSAKQRMRMADYRSMRGILNTCIQQSFQPSSWAIEKKRFDGRIRSHHPVQIT